MPIYEYECDTCRGRFEELVRNGETKLRCPFCGSSQVVRKVSLCGFKSASGSGRMVKTGCSGCTAGHGCSSCSVAH